MHRYLTTMVAAGLLFACDSKDSTEEDTSVTDTVSDITDTGTDTPADTAEDPEPDTEEDVTVDVLEDTTIDAVEDTAPETRECTTEEIEACDENATCTIEEDMPVCTCNEGWTGPGDICINVDECDEGTDDCDVNATCTDVPGSFECECNEYYTGTGTFCYEIDPETHVADISDNPIAIEISGVGTYDIHAMGRLAQEFEYTSTPGSGFRMERTPTSWMIHDLVMQDITAQAGSDISDLVSWASSTTSRSATITLDGLGYELLELVMYDVVPVSADTGVTSGSMSELVVSIGEIDSTTGNSSYTPPLEQSIPGNSTMIEISGIACISAFLPDNITEAAADTADPIELRKVGKNYSPGYGDASGLIDWFQYSSGFFDSYGDIERRAMSQIHFDATVTETDRVNCFETFPALIYYFNPAKDYGTSYLIDLTIATEFCEQAL